VAEVRLGIQIDDKGSPVVKQFIQNLQRIQPSTEAVNAELRKLGFVVDQNNRVFNAAGQAIGDKAANALRTLATGGDVATKSLNRLGDQVARGTQQFQQQSEGTKSFGASLLTSAGSAVKFGAAMVGVQLGLGAISTVVQGAIHATTSFEQSLNNIAALGTVSQQGLGRLREQLLSLPPVLGDTTTLAKGLYDILGANVPEANAIEVLQVSAELAKAGVGNLDTAIVAVTKSMAAFGIPIEDARKKADNLLPTPVVRGAWQPSQPEES